VRRSTTEPTEAGTDSVVLTDEPRPATREPTRTAISTSAAIPSRSSVLAVPCCPATRNGGRHRSEALPHTLYGGRRRSPLPGSPGWAVFLVLERQPELGSVRDLAVFGDVQILLHDFGHPQVP
jgi:hypothetical protein